MNTKVLLLSAVVTGLAFTAFATEPLLSPRAAGNQIKVVSGSSTELNSLLKCQRNMISSPRAVAECSSHTTMPGCMTVAALK